MIQRMMSDIAVFVAFVLIFIFGFGVAFQAVLYPDTEFAAVSVTNVFYRSVPVLSMSVHTLVLTSTSLGSSSSTTTALSLTVSARECPFIITVLIYMQMGV